MGFPFKNIFRGLTKSKLVTKTVTPTVKTVEQLPAVVNPITTVQPVVSTVKPVVQAYQIQHLPGYQLKSLMSGNPLEKQLSKTGTISTASVDALAKKMSAVEQAVISKVLAEKFPGQKAVDYNDFRKGVQDELITYDRTPSLKFDDYGLNRLGLYRQYNAEDFNDFLKNSGYSVRWSNNYNIEYYNPTTGDIKDYNAFHDLYNDHAKKVGANLHTFTFSSPRIPQGSAKHYDANTLGHSRTYTTADEPDVLHVMESQSDWAQAGIKEYKDSGKRAEQLRGRIERLTREIADEEQRLGARKRIDGSTIENDWEVEQLREIIQRDKQTLNDANRELDRLYNQSQRGQEHYLADNYTSRQIQENLRYAAEKGQKKMRYPTRETAAKIEGYPERQAYYDASGKDVTTDKSVDLFDYHDDGRLAEINNRESEIHSQMDYLQSNLWKGEEKVDAQRLMAELDRDLSKLMKEKWSIIDNAELKPGFTKKVVYDNENILKRYSDFPKQFGKLFKGATVRTTQDLHGNTWYEVDVPKDYLQQEWAFKQGGTIKSIF